MLNRSLLGTACGIALAVGSSAQNVVVVDSLRRAGYHFVDLPPAVAAAVAGDVILVRDAPGFPYTPATITKGISVIGGRYDFDTTPMTVQNVPAGETCTLESIVSRGDSAPLRLDLRGNAGAVVLTSVRAMDPLPSFPYVVSAIRIEDCTDVALHRCQAWGKPGMLVVRSRVVASDSLFNGVDAIGGSGAPGVAAVDAEVMLAQCEISGTQAGVFTLGSRLDAAGDGRAYIQGQGGAQTPAILGIGGLLSIDPVLRLNPYSSGPPIAGTAVVVSRSLPYALAGYGGTTRPWSLGAPANASAVLFAGVPILPVATPIGALWFDPAVAVVLTSGVVTATRRLSVTVNLPPTLPIGARLVVQGAALMGTDLRLSTPAHAMFY